MLLPSAARVNPPELASAWTSISIHREPALLCQDPCRAVTHPRLSRTLRCHTDPPALEVGKPTFPQEIPFVWAAWRNPRTGTFCTSEGELTRSSCDISQWTDRYSNPLGSSRAPSASMNLPLAIYQVFAVIPRWVHTDGAGKGPRFPTSRKLSFPWLRRNL